MTATDAALSDLVTANRILAREGVMDAFGHVSIRHPEAPDRFVMSYAKSPELVEPDDLGVYDLAGALLSDDGRKPYSERFIHAGVYEARPDVMAVVHNHAYDVIPFAVTERKLQPITHTGAVMGFEIPTWDIHDRFGDTNMLVVNMEQARDLARRLGDNTAVLMRGHGCVVVGTTLKRAVASAVYMQVNARLQLAAMQIGEPTFLTQEEARLAAELNLGPVGVERAWEYWSRRASA